MAWYGLKSRHSCSAHLRMAGVSSHARTQVLLVREGACQCERGRSSLETRCHRNQGSLAAQACILDFVRAESFCMTLMVWWVMLRAAQAHSSVAQSRFHLPDDTQRGSQGANFVTQRFFPQDLSCSELVQSWSLLCPPPLTSCR